MKAKPLDDGFEARLAELQARIAELERQLEEARKDADWVNPAYRMPPPYTQVLILSDCSTKYSDTEYANELQLGCIDAYGEWSFKGVSAQNCEVKGWKAIDAAMTKENTQ